MHRTAAAVAAVAVVLASLLAMSGAASAHESRNVGPYKVQVGWLNEPAYAGLLNGLDLTVTDTRNGKPIEGLDKALTVDVAAGGLAPISLTITPRKDTPGAYEGWFVPTKTGGYTFHLTGKIDTLDIDEKFESGPNTFDDVEDLSGVQYPTAVPVGDALNTRLGDLQSSADQARLLAIVGVGLGLAGLVAGLAAFTRRPRA